MVVAPDRQAARRSTSVRACGAGFPFAALEAPEELAFDVREFFRSVSRS